VSDRTDQKPTVQLEVPRELRDQLNQYKSELYRVLKRRATQAEILGAMLNGVPLWQADAMIQAYRPGDKP
jgi:hypothetical protein